MPKNYYAILGISPTASLEEIKAAYRRRAKEYHPDRYAGESDPFLDVQEAYAVLGNPAHRIRYDQHRREPWHDPRTVRPEPEALRPQKSGVEPLKSTGGHPQGRDVSLLHSFRTCQPSFDEVFDRLWKNFSSITHPKSATLQNLNAELLLTLEQAHWGGQVRIFVPAQAICPTCSGRGDVGYYSCWRCGGSGSISGEYPVTVAFPPGINDGHQVAIPLDRFGIHNLYLTLLFRVSGRAEIEEL